MHKAFVLLWLAPIILAVIGYGFLTLLMMTNDNCVVNEGFSSGCMFLGRDVSDFAVILGFWLSWGMIFFGMPWVMILGLGYGIWRIVRNARAR